MRNVENNKGITLIALVITIIVLLILAAVSIATLIGDNGLLTKANDAKTETEIASLKEQIQLDILAVQVGNEELTEQKLTEILGKYNASLDGEEIRVEGKDYTIALADIYSGSLSSAFDPETLTIGTAINTDKYGWKVTNYNVEETETGGWRLFFQDDNYAYLISDNCIGSYRPSDYYFSYTEVGIVGQKLNPKISSLFTESNTYENIRITAWLTDTSEESMWAKYKNEDAVFAIGSPTAELFAASYNNTGKSNTITLGLGTYGYTENTGSGWLSVNDNHGIYNKSTSSDWWLASPYGSSYSSYELLVRGLGFFYCNGDGTSYAVRPLVCIPTSVFNSKYATSTTLVDE